MRLNDLPPLSIYNFDLVNRRISECPERILMGTVVLRQA